ncbi:MAG: deoxyguanosinetriphosphate triphosphohydrolase [Actinomycetia bacterium]|nr:deoxyguanosinetriphosphate triphosphohydrolase [Actinomycetes bacterium]
MGETMGGYDDVDVARRVVESGKSSRRSAFARDRARVLHSWSLRRLAAKTQVVVPWESDFPRTRLTHSLEVAQIGRELGQALGCDPDLVETAGLAHDLGHPPFGHNGEQALDEVAQGCGGFEGNAQSLRILSRLETKVLDDSGASAGLNLTRATLDAATKYPWPRSLARRKYGVYADDIDVFDWLRSGAPVNRRCMEAQVMDWADDIAYSVHDFEDAIHAGHLPLGALHDPVERKILVDLTQQRFAVSFEWAQLEAALDRLLELPYWPHEYDESHRAMAALKNTTSELIARFCLSAEEATRATSGDGPLRRYHADLVVPSRVRAECAVLKAITAQYVMLRKGAQERYAQQREIVTELAHVSMLGAPSTLEPMFAEWFGQARDDAGRLRVVIDQVASLTDTAALAMFGKLRSR